MNKKCASCKVTKPVADYAKDSTRRDSLQSCCRDCKRKTNKTWNVINPDKRRAIGREARLKQKYGLTQAAYDRMLRAQDDVCAICFQPNAVSDWPLYVDHDHATGAIRALLCGACNTALGMMQDSPDRLRAAARYLELHDPANLESTHSGHFG